jgi:hypothetical protein
MNPLLLTLVLAGSGMSLAYNQHAPILPDPKLSPGTVLTSDPTVICVAGYTKTVRSVSQALKNEVFRSYGITSREPREFEVDHVISLELGGSNAQTNLFPESYKTMPLNAHTKDRLENRLHALACSGKITMTEAQQAIARDWTAAYTKYVGPLPGSTQPAPASTPASIPATPLSPAPVTTVRAAPKADGSCPPRSPVKVSRAGIYHLPQGDGNYTRTQAVACFRDASSAAAAGYRGSR